MGSGSGDVPVSAALLRARRSLGMAGLAGGSERIRGISGNGGTVTRSMTRSRCSSGSRGAGGCAIRQLQASSRWTPSVAARGQPGLLRG